MSSRAKKDIAVVLVLTVVILNGLFTLQIAAHALQHVQHQPSTEASSGCTWACSAGEIVDSPEQPFNQQAPLIGSAEILNPLTPFVISSNLPVSRAPPQTFC